MCAPTGGGPVAQSVEHLTFNQMVAGSIPAGLTTFPDGAGQGARPDIGARPKRRSPSELPGMFLWETACRRTIFTDSERPLHNRFRLRQDRVPAFLRRSRTHRQSITTHDGIAKERVKKPDRFTNTRHSRESGNLLRRFRKKNRADIADNRLRIPAFAGMTNYYRMFLRPLHNSFRLWQDRVPGILRRFRTRRRRMAMRDGIGNIRPLPR